MAGTLDWIKRKVRCPFCMNIIDIDFCIDFNQCLRPITVESIAGGHFHCPKCKRVIYDDDSKEFCFDIEQNEQ